jgi:hypothetical protein
MRIFASILKLQQNGEIFTSLFFHENDDSRSVRFSGSNCLGYLP